MNVLKVVKLKRRKKQKEGVVVTLLRAKVSISKNGLNGAAVRIPQTYLRELGWKPGETECYVTLQEDRKILVEPVKAEKEKAS